MLKKLIQYKFLNSFLYSFVPLLRIPAIFFFIGADFFKNYVLLNSLTLFIPETLFITYDSKKSNDRLEIKFIINVALLVSLLFVLVGALFQNVLICLISYAVFDQLSIIDSVNRDKYKSIYYHIVRITTVLLIIFKLFLYIFVISLISYIFFVRSESTLSSKNVFKGLFKNIKLVGITRIRDFLFNNFLVISLDNNIFFGFKIIQSGFANLAGLHYSYIRNNILDLDNVKKYFHFIGNLIRIIALSIFAIISLSIISNQIFLFYLLLLFIPIIFSVENIISQLNLLYIKDAIHRMTISNIFVLIGFGLINIIIHKMPINSQNNLFYFVFVFFLIFISIFILLKNKKLRLKKNEE